MFASLFVLAVVVLGKTNDSRGRWQCDDFRSVKDLVGGSSGRGQRWQSDCVRIGI